MKYLLCGMLFATALHTTGHAAEQACDMNGVIARATLVGQEVAARMADGRLAPDDMNGELGQRINQANTAFEEDRMDDACAQYQAIIDDYEIAAPQ